MRRQIGLLACGVLCVAVACAPASQAQSSSERGPDTTVEYFSADGRGAYTEVPARSAGPLTPRTAERAAQGDGDVELISFTGAKDTRLDVTILGDGYTAAEQDELSADARTAWSAFLSTEPYRSYSGLMNARLVHAVSADSGVSGDPTSGVVRDTALGAAYWCDGIERLVCVDLDRVRTYAALSPESDIVLVLVNSAKYGGAGYQDLDDLGYPFAGVATFAAKNTAAALIAVHEVGHSLGDLADEYDYGDGSTWTGGEIPRPNVSNKTAAQILASSSKWYRWLGTSDPSGGTVGAYEGAYYNTYGAYRPTADSLMRSLSSPRFNAPSREWLINGVYRYGDSLTARTPTGTVQPRNAVLRVGKAPLRSGLSRVQIRWFVDGVEKKAQRNRLSVRPSAIGVPADGRIHSVSAKAIDRTAAVREPSIRARSTNAVAWRVK